MPPNARPPVSLIYETEDEEPSIQDALLEMLDKKADTAGLANINADNEDWTDVKHSERKKRDRVLDDGVLIKLMRKSDYKGFERLFVNLSIMALTAYAVYHIVDGQGPRAVAALPIEKLALFTPLYFFYGFQFQCFAFAGQHEFLHRNAFKTKIYNDICLYLVGLFCFELGVHEKVMHKQVRSRRPDVNALSFLLPDCDPLTMRTLLPFQHHTFTNNIDLDPELTSYYTREQLENPGFRNLPFSRLGYFRQFFDIAATFKCRVGKILCSALGIAVDYSGWGWSLSNWTYSKESGIMRMIQMTALSQVALYCAIYFISGQTREGIERLLFWWIVPVLIGYPCVNYFRNLEHADCEVSKEPNCLRNTRSVRSNILIRTLLWDTNYHAEHHCYPMVPFFNLCRVNEHMYAHVIHNEYDHFTTQNWAAVKPGGWIDQQRERVEASKPKDE
jgi:fatty acid desaturase